jgi:hypothetical protein
MFYAEICPMVRRHNARPEGINMGVWWQSDQCCELVIPLNMGVW